MKKIKQNKKNAKAFKINSDPLKGDLSNYIQSHDWQKFDQQFELLPKTKSITLRIGQELLNQLKSLAEAEGVDYQKLIRGAIADLIRKKAS
jgi:predicted DNA binding CopG/RHH family protein